MTKRQQRSVWAALGPVLGLCLASGGCTWDSQYGRTMTSKENTVAYGPRVMASQPAPAPTATASAQPEKPGKIHNLFAALGLRTKSPQPQAKVIQPGEEIQWSVQTAEVQPGQVNGGRASVGPDGSVVVGPYGTYKLAGMTQTQASSALQRQLSPYLKNPNATVRVYASPDSAPVEHVPVVTVPEPTNEVIWRTARPNFGR